MLPNPIIEFNIGTLPIKIHMYGLMIAVGLICVFWVLFSYSKKRGIDPSFTDFVYYNAIVAIALGFGSAALFQATYDFIEDPSAGFQIGGGITFIGGLIGGVVAFLVGYAIFRKRLKGRLVDSLSIIPCCILIGHAFGRVGCFFAGCCHGKPTDAFCGVAFPGYTGSVKVHPTQLYEALFLFLMFAICTYLLFKFNFKHNMSVYLVSYGLFRFFIEFVRDDERGELVAGITPSQFWSILMILAGVGLVFLMDHLTEKRAAELAAVAVNDAPSTEETDDAETAESTDSAEETEGNLENE